MTTASGGGGGATKETKKTWKGKVARQWKKMHPGDSSSKSSSQTGSSGYPEGGSIGVPLEECPIRPTVTADCPVSESSSSSNYLERVPHLVKVCTSIVEERGLEIVGIYRVPGNNAAVTHLTDTVNRPNRY